MSRILKVAYETTINHCGECYHDMGNKCELTNSVIDDHWAEVLPDCPLEEKGDE